MAGYMEYLDAVRTAMQTGGNVTERRMARMPGLGQFAASLVGSKDR